MNNKSNRLRVRSRIDIDIIINALNGASRAPDGGYRLPGDSTIVKFGDECLFIGQLQTPAGKIDVRFSVSLPSSMKDGLYVVTNIVAHPSSGGRLANLMIDIQVGDQLEAASTKNIIPLSDGALIVR